MMPQAIHAAWSQQSVWHPALPSLVKGLVEFSSSVESSTRAESPKTPGGSSMQEDSACKSEVAEGSPDPKHISTSDVERQNLTMRMSMRRFTRLTNAFSKKVENHAAAVALYCMWYNFGRVHQTLRVTPAMKAGIADHVWSFEEMTELLA